MSKPPGSVGVEMIGVCGSFAQRLANGRFGMLCDI